MIFAAQGGVDVDVCQPKRRNSRGRALFKPSCSMTAAFLLSDTSPTSKDGRELLLRNHELIVNFDGAKSQIKGTVLELVPTMQRLINSSLSAENQKAFVEKVVALSLKERTSLGFVKTTLLAGSNRVPIVNNANCGRLLQALENARPAEPSIRTNRFSLRVEGKHSKRKTGLH